MSKNNAIPAYKNPYLSIDERVDDLVSRMTLEEKISQMLYSSTAIGRLDIHEYNWWNECLHGVARQELQQFSHRPSGWQQPLIQTGCMK